MEVSKITEFGFEFIWYKSDDVNEWLDMFYKRDKYHGENICWDDLNEGTRTFHLFNNTILIKDFYNYSHDQGKTRKRGGLSIFLLDEGEMWKNEDGEMVRKGKSYGTVHPKDIEIITNILRSIKLRSILE